MHIMEWFEYKSRMQEIDTDQDFFIFGNKLEDIQEFLTRFESHPYAILQDLDQNELLILAKIYDYVIQKKTIPSVENFSIPLASAQLLSHFYNLQRQGILFVSKKIHSVVLTHSVDIFDHVKEFFLHSAYPVFSHKAELQKIVQTYVQDIFDVPQNALDLKFYYLWMEYGFFLPEDFYQKLLLPEEKEQVRAIPYIYPTFAVKENEMQSTEIVLGYFMHLKQIPLSFEPYQHQEIKPIHSYQNYIFVLWAKMVLDIYKRGIQLNKDQTVKQSTLSRFTKMGLSEYWIQFFIRFMFQEQYLLFVPDRGLYELSPSIFHFFQQDLAQMYLQFILKNDLVAEVFYILENIEAEFFPISCISFFYQRLFSHKSRHLHIHPFLHSSLIRIIELFVAMGILTKHLYQERYTLFSKGEVWSTMQKKSFHQPSEDEKSIKPKQTITLTHTLEFYMTENIPLSLQYQIGMFCEVKSITPLLVYQVTQESVQRAMFFGFSIEVWIKELQDYGIQIEPSALNIIQYFQKKFFRVDIVSGILCTGASEVLDRIQYHKIYKDYVIQRISDQYILMDKKAVESKVIEEEGIFFYDI